ncbi:hypothetical protein Vi05172_g1836 [Venturia inaequalis]|nr:hypothetical protein Vi05172_g1836 [Venturia inaequalis]
MLKTFLLCLSFSSCVPGLAGFSLEPRQVPSKAIWQPAVGAKFQIILESYSSRNRNADLVPTDADIHDVDLFDTTADVIQRLHSRGKKVICYMNAGSSESWRPDYTSIKAADKGDVMKEWRREQWLDIRSPDIFEIMKERIQMASTKGCDGIDPDNIDAYGDESGRGGGFASKLTKQDSINYIKKLADEAHRHGLAIGLKNAEAILPSVQSFVQYAVSEECATMYEGCSQYIGFINQGRPVFHIEYAKYNINGTSVQLTAENSALGGLPTAQLQAIYCLQAGLSTRRAMSKDVGAKFSTVIKTIDLNKAVTYCDGTTVGLEGLLKSG